MSACFSKNITRIWRYNGQGRVSRKKKLTHLVTLT